MIDSREYNPLDDLEDLPPLTDLEDREDQISTLKHKLFWIDRDIKEIINLYDGVFENNVVINKLKKIVNYDAIKKSN